MATIRLLHRGIGVWISRAHHWELLFPAADKRIKGHAGPGPDYLPRHPPILKIRDSNLPPSVPDVYDLSDCTLDITGLSPTNAPGNLSHTKMIGLAIDPNSLLRGGSTLDGYSDLVVGMIRVPKSLIHGHKDSKNDISFGSHAAKKLATLIEWTADFQTWDRKITIVPRSGSAIEIQLVGNDITLEVDSLSVHDREVPANRREKRNADHDFAANYLLTADRNNPQFPGPIPTWIGTLALPAAGPGTARKSALVVRLVVDPDHLCTPAFGEPDPLP